MTRERREKARETAIWEGGGEAPARARRGSAADGKQGPREAAPLTLLTLRAREVRAGLPQEGERAARLLRSPPRPGLLLQPAGRFSFLLRHPPCLSQVSGRTGSAAGSGGGMHGTARRRESLCGGVTLRSSRLPGDACVQLAASPVGSGAASA